MEAWNTFNSRVNLVILKCCYRFNQVGVRDNIINEGITNRDCPRCGEDKNWEHVILCKDNHFYRAEFIYELETILPKIEGDITL